MVGIILCSVITYDYINGYIYINTINTPELSELGNIIVESVFEYPHLIETETHEGVIDIDAINDDDEFLLPEDMIGDIKKLVLETFNAQVPRDTNEIPSANMAQ